ADFVEAIREAVGACEILIALIGKDWLESAGANGRRLDNPKDFVRLEIAAALERDVRVIPVLVQEARMPNPEELPEDLSRLSHRNAVELSDARWKYDVDQLIDVMERILARQRAARGKAAGETQRLEAEAARKREAEEAKRREAEAEELKRRAAGREPIPSKETSAPDVDPLPGAGGGTAGRHDRPRAGDDTQPPRNKRMLVLAAIALGLAVVGVTAVVLMKPSPPTAATNSTAENPPSQISSTTVNTSSAGNPSQSGQQATTNVGVTPAQASASPSPTRTVDRPATSASPAVKVRDDKPTPTATPTPPPTPTPTPIPTATPTPPPTPTPTPRRPSGPTSVGNLNGKAISKPQPSYPAIAKAARVSGMVVVQVTVDESGKVISARAISGHPLLQPTAVSAAYGARFAPMLVSGQPVKMTGVLTYTFNSQ
ncbi:MAG TPA: TonB family protein, partial [Pyrinomonadaceae bacterium]|nr:TonB family protein [Pyrinomonadaceae bacterium]